MTREEAINWLDRLYMGANITDEYGDMENMQLYEEALNIAVKALEQEPILDKIRAEIEQTRKMYLDMNDIDWLNGCDYVLSVIDKYNAESEE